MKMNQRGVVDPLSVILVLAGFVWMAFAIGKSEGKENCQPTAQQSAQLQEAQPR